MPLANQRLQNQRQCLSNYLILEFFNNFAQNVRENFPKIETEVKLKLGIESDFDIAYEDDQSQKCKRKSSLLCFFI